MKLFHRQLGNGASNPINISSENNPVSLNNHTIGLAGNLDGATILIQVSPDSSDGPLDRWVPDGSIPAFERAEAKTFKIIAKRLRLFAIGGGPSMDVDAYFE